MISITTRTAKLEDLEILLTFEQGIITAERPFDPTLKDGIIHYYDIKEMILADDVEVIVATVDDKVIGSGYARIETPKPYLKHQKFAYLGFMYVVPEYRGLGVIGHVLRSLYTWVKSKDIDEVRLDVYDENAGAVRAYEKAGFQKHLVNMRLSLKTL